MSVSIKSIGTAVPEFQIDQKSVFEFMAKAHELEGAEKTRLQALYRASAIKSRHSVVPDYGTLDKAQWQLYPANERLCPFPTTKERNELYRKKALPLAISAVNDAVKPQELKNVTHLISVSCTGLYAPGLDIDLIEALGLDAETERTCINYMGCYAAITALKSANAICKADPSAQVLIVCVELCTIHFQKESDENNLIANAIFSDGAAAALISSEESEQIQLNIDGFLSRLFPSGKDEMAWNIGNTGFEMKLTTYVPDLIESGIDKLLKDLGAKNADLCAVHPGGKRILDVVEKSLNLDRSQNAFAHKVLRNYGNMSSPTILFVLKMLLDDLQKEDKGKTVAAIAFGPGLTIETAKFRVG